MPCTIRNLVTPPKSTTAVEVILGTVRMLPIVLYVRSALSVSIPPVVINGMRPEVRDETESLVVDAFVSTAVDEAKNEKGVACIQSAVVVAFATWLPKFVVEVKANAALPSESVPHETTPAVAFRSQFVAFNPETTRAVEDAVPFTVIAVVEA